VRDIKDIKCFEPRISSPDKSRSKVYHYTSPEGLYAILEKQTLRFTDCQFLNDKSEAMYIRKPLMKTLGGLRDQLNPGFRETIEELFNQNYETEPLNPSYSEWRIATPSENAGYYIFCLSEGKDLLNMWNYYVKNGNYQGYNICFTINQLVKCLERISINNMRVFYGQVLYTDKEQTAALQTMLLELNLEYVNWYNLTQNKEQSLLEIRSKVLDYINDCKLFYKDESFAGEREYRFVIKLPGDYTSHEEQELKMGFTIKNGIFTPCCEILLDPRETINSITIAPIMEKDLAERGLRRFLSMHHYNQRLTIEASSIPIRY
jgi:hypothetical protein